MTEEIITVESGELPAISDDRIVEIAERAEKRIAAVKKIKELSLRVTNKHDWVDQNGKPYLQASGAEKIARMFGISWTIDEPLKESLEEGHYMYSYKGTFSAFGVSIEAVGSRSSKDGFFKKYNYQNGSKTELPPSEIDPGDVKKSAYTNCIGNGVTRILGIRNLTWEEVEKHSGVKKSETSRVDYKSGGKNPPSENGKGGTATKLQHKKLFAMLKGKNFADEDVDTFYEFLIDKFQLTTKDDLTKNNMSDVFNDFDGFCKQFLNWEKSQESND